jgi:hypothetical protein
MAWQTLLNGTEAGPLAGWSMVWMESLGNRGLRLASPAFLRMPSETPPSQGFKIIPRASSISPVANPHDVDGVADHVSRLGFLQRRLIDDLARAGRKAGLTEGH